MDTLITPSYLNQGDTIGIIAPARRVSESEIMPFALLLKRAGYQVRFGDHLYGSHHQYSGSAEERLGDFHKMVSDPEVKAIFSARGGYGSVQLLPGLDFSLLSKNPKWLAGFSDMTAIHSAANRYIETMHAVMPYSLVMENPQDKQSFETMLDTIRGVTPEYKLPGHPLNVNGNAEGRMIGGNLSVLYSLAGSSYEPDYEGKILFLEDLDEYIYHIDRMIMNFELRDIFKKISGLVIGDMSDMHDNTIPFGKNALEIIADRAHKYRIPAMFGFPAGHNKSNYTLIFGRVTTLKVKEGEVNLVQ